MEPTAQGVLGKTPFAHLVVYCVDKKLRGALVLRPEGDDDAAAADVLTLVDGLPAKIRIADPVEHLGRVLLEIGAIDDLAYNESLMALGKGGVLQGQVLLAAGKIDAPTLEKGLRTQIARKLGHLFSRPPSTRYAYYDNVDFLSKFGGPELYPVDPTPAVFASVRAHPSMPHADATLERVKGTPLRIKPGAPLSSLDFTRPEREVVELLRLAAMSIEQVLDAHVADARTVRLLLYGLLLLKHIEPMPVAVAAPAPPSVQMPPPALGRQPSPVVRVALKRIGTPLQKGAVEVAPKSDRDPRSEPRPDPHAGRRAEIEAKLSELKDASHFAALGVEAAASIEEVKNAYFQLAKRWHPDRLPPELANEKEKVATIFTRLAEAYQVLTDPTRRADYEKALAAGISTADQEEVHRVMSAHSAFQKAEFFVGKNQLAEAKPFAVQAYEGDPTDPEHVALYCWIMANEPERRESGKYDDLLLKIGVALAESPRSERIKFLRAMLLKAAGRMGDAIRDFREIAEQNPRHVEAAREVRLYTMRNERDRKGKDEGNDSLLGRFLKKK